MDEQKILELAGKLVLAGATKDEGEIVNISSELAAILRQSGTEDNNISAEKEKTKVWF